MQLNIINLRHIAPLLYTSIDNSCTPRRLYTRSPYSIRSFLGKNNIKLKWHPESILLFMLVINLISFCIFYYISFKLFKLPLSLLKKRITLPRLWTQDFVSFTKWCPVKHWHWLLIHNALSKLSWHTEFTWQRSPIRTGPVIIFFFFQPLAIVKISIFIIFCSLSSHIMTRRRSWLLTANAIWGICVVQEVIILASARVLFAFSVHHGCAHRVVLTGQSNGWI